MKKSLPAVAVGEGGRVDKRLHGRDWNHVLFSYENLGATTSTLGGLRLRIWAANPNPSNSWVDWSRGGRPTKLIWVIRLVGCQERIFRETKPTKRGVMMTRRFSKIKLTLRTEFEG